MILGYCSPTLRIHDLSVLNGLLNRQALMMAYDRRVHAALLAIRYRAAANASITGKRNSSGNPGR